MKRDMDVVRRIILALEQADDLIGEVDGVSQASFNFHGTLLIEAGLCAGTVSDHLGNEDTGVWLYRLTWAGSDFASSIQSDTIWNTVKARVIKPGASWTFGLLSKALEQEIIGGGGLLETLGGGK